MLTLVIALLSGVVVAFAGNLLFPEAFGLDWGIALGILGFFLASLPINLIVRKRQERIFQNVQGMIEQSQGALRRKVNRMQNKVMGSTKGIQKQLEKQQTAAIREALEALHQADALKKWNILAEKQTNTLRAQLCYQIKDFEKADVYFKSAMEVDPLTVAMKMTRLYKQGDMEGVSKLFNKRKKRFKGENGAIIYALYSWILVKEKDLEKAVEVLDEGKDKTENEVLKANWEHLVNGRVRNFSNAGLGDYWYTLHLETPKAVRVKQRMGKRMR